MRIGLKDTEVTPSCHCGGAWKTFDTGGARQVPAGTRTDPYRTVDGIVEAPVIRCENGHAYEVGLTTPERRGGIHVELVKLLGQHTA